MHTSEERLDGHLIRVSMNGFIFLKSLGSIDPPKSPKLSLISPNKKEVEMKPKIEER